MKFLKKTIILLGCRSTRYKKWAGFGIEKWNFRSVKSVQIVLWLSGLNLLECVISEIVRNESLIIGNRCDNLWHLVLYIVRTSDKLEICKTKQAEKFANYGRRGRFCSKMSKSTVYFSFKILFICQSEYLISEIRKEIQITFYIRLSTLKHPRFFFYFCIYQLNIIHNISTGQYQFFF